MLPLDASLAATPAQVHLKDRRIAKRANSAVAKPLPNRWANMVERLSHQIQLKAGL